MTQGKSRRGVASYPFGSLPNCECEGCLTARALDHAREPMIAKVRAPLASCEESEARRAVATFPEHDATPEKVDVPTVTEGDS